MARRRGVDIMGVNLSSYDKTAASLRFIDVLEYVNGKNYYYAEGGKYLELIIVERNKEDGLVKGVVITTQDSDIPPKRNKRTGEMSSVDIDVNIEGFAYANAFLYDVKRSMLIYEINKNGCFPKLLKEMIYNLWNAKTDIAEERPKFNVSFPFVARKHQYNRMLRMSYYKKFCIQLASPQNLLNEFVDENDSMHNAIKALAENAIEGNADMVVVEQSVHSRKMSAAGLSKSNVRSFVDMVMSCFKKEDIMKIEVQGYIEDSEDPNRCKIVNLLSDVFDEYFTLKDIQVHEDLQLKERMAGVEKVYRKIYGELVELFG